MRRAWVPAFLAAAALATPVASSPAAAPAQPADSPSRLLVTAREFDLTLSRVKLEPGPSVVQLYDFGEDPHDLAIQRAGAAKVFTIPEVLPGETGTLQLGLRRSSRYRLWCSLPGHAELGMRASLRTSRR